ncbi:MAG: helix-turn-helix domain-containing protein [Saprospiraceae bacterium]|nr:helix-turn-helix domain-containing protein [Saprospiraceae bacterium]
MENIFGENIRFLRKSKKLTLIEFSDQLSVSKSALSDYETGKSIPGLDVVQKFSTYFQIPIDELYNSRIPEGRSTGSSHNSSDQEKNLQQVALENEKYMFNLKLLHQKLESQQIQMQLVRQLLESREAENKTLKMNIRLLEAQLKNL